MSNLILKRVIKNSLVILNDKYELLSYFINNLKYESAPIVEVDYKDGQALSKIPIGYDYRAAVCININDELVFNYPKCGYTAGVHKLLMSIGVMDTKYISLYSTMSIKFTVVITHRDGEESFSHILPINGTYQGDWESGVACYLSEFWADNIIRFPIQRQILKIRYRFNIVDKEGQLISRAKAHRIKPVVAWPVVLK